MEKNTKKEAYVEPIVVKHEALKEMTGGKYADKAPEKID